MLQLTGMDSVLRGVSMLYWLVAIGALVLVIWKGKKWWGKAIGALLVLGVFGYLPVTNWLEASKREAYAREAWAYFKKKCETESGEKIYRTFTEVRSVLVVKPLPPASEKDLFDQFWYGDPYSNATPWDKRGELTAGRLAGISRRPTGLQRGLDFVEVKYQEKNEARYQRIYRPTSNDALPKVETIETPVSRYGVYWEDISTPDDRKYWVAGSKLRVTDLTDDSVIAERIGYVIEAGFGSNAGQRRPWLASRGSNTTCPNVHDYSDQWFITSVFKQVEEK